MAGFPGTRRRTSRLRRMIQFGLLAVVVLAGIGVAAIVMLAIAIYSQARHDETAPADAIVVMGTAQWDGRPSPTFKARLDQAYDLYQERQAPLIVLTGGTGAGDQYSEAEVGWNYLLERGVPTNAMVAVTVGRTSLQSLRQADVVLRQRSATRVLLVSDAFHMFRIKRMAEDLGLSPLASPTQTSPIRAGSPLEYRYMARELFAYLAYVFLKQ